MRISPLRITSLLRKRILKPGQLRRREKITRITAGTVFNPLVTNGLSHPYHLDESTFIFRGIKSKISFLFHFLMKFVNAYSVCPCPIKRMPGLYRLNDPNKI